MSRPILIRGTVEGEAGFRRSLKTRLRLSTGLLALLFAVTPASIDPVQISFATTAAHAGDNGNNNGGNNNGGHGDNDDGGRGGSDDGSFGEGSLGGGNSGDSDDGNLGNNEDGDYADRDDVVEDELTDLNEELDQELDDGAEAEALGSRWN